MVACDSGRLVYKMDHRQSAVGLSLLGTASIA